MKHLITITFLTFLFFIPTFAQSKTNADLETQNKTFKKSSRCAINYDKFKDATFVYSSPVGVSFLTTIRVEFDFVGQTLNTPVKSYLFSITTLNLIQDTSLIFIANGERVNIGRATASNQPTEVLGQHIYTQIYNFTPEQLEKFASVEKVEFQIGNTAFSTAKDSSEKMKNLIALGTLK